MIIVKSSFYSMMMHQWTLLLEDSLRKKERYMGTKLELFRQRLSMTPIFSTSIQMMMKRKVVESLLLLSLFIIIVFPSISRQSYVFVNEAV